MKLEYIGHACFRMTAQDGTCAITDPYDGGVGIAMLPLTADLITMLINCIISFWVYFPILKIIFRK